MATWTLYVDETGSVGDPSEDAAVGGWVWTGEPDDPSLTRFEDRMRALYRGLPWPPHGYLADKGTTWLAYRLAATTPGHVLATLPRPGVEAVGAAVDVAVRVIRAEANRTGRQAQMARRLIRRAEELVPDLTNRQQSRLFALDQQTLRVLGRTREIREITRATRRLSRHRAILLAAVARTRPAPKPFAVFARAAGESGEDRGDARYLGIFTVLVERVVHLLDHQPGGPHRLWIAPCHFGTVAQRQLVAAAQARSSLPDARGTTVEILEPCAYRHADVGRVAADLVLGDLLGGPFRRANTRLRDASAEGERTSGLAMVAAPSWHPHPLFAPAHTGPARELVLAALRGQPATASEALLPVWARGQAKAWAAAIRERWP